MCVGQSAQARRHPPAGEEYIGKNHAIAGIVTGALFRNSNSAAMAYPMAPPSHIHKQEEFDQFQSQGIGLK